MVTTLYSGIPGAGSFVLARVGAGTRGCSTIRECYGRQVVMQVQVLPPVRTPRAALSLKAPGL